MQQKHEMRHRWRGLRVSRRQRSLLVFWGGIALVLLLGFRQIFADPDRTNNTPLGSVVISEFGAAGSGPADEYGNTPDWIELHNRALTPVELANWSLTDDPTQPDKWVFGDAVIAPGGYLVVFASGRDQGELDEEELFFHTNFRLNSEGGFLALYPPTSRRFMDGTSFDYPAQTPQNSYALVQNGAGQWSPRYLAHPTPGAANDTSLTWAGVLPAVSASVPHGFYDAPIEVALHTEVAGATLVYTLDGSTPTVEHGIPYTQPIVISQTTPLRAVALLPDYAPSPVMTQSYLFLENIVNQPANPAGWPETWGTHSLSRGPNVAGTPVKADYAMDPRVVNDAEDGALLEEGLLALPTISLVTDMANFDIYATPQARGRESERAVSVEWIDPNGTDGGFQVNAGVRIQGNAGRLEYMPKHSFRLFFRQSYGAAKLIYPLFEDSHVTEFETLVLRGGVNWGFAGDYLEEGASLALREKTTYIRDEWARASQIAMSGEGAHGRFAHLYINGLYWGLYNLVERPDASFAASYLGGDEEEWGSVNHGGLVSGAPDRFWVLSDLTRAGGMEDPAKYATLLEFFDPEQFSDYVILNWYMGNHDWPETNWYASVHNPAGRNVFWVWDAEASWNHGAWIDLGGDTVPSAPHPNVVRLLFNAAKANPDFRMTFADRLYHNLVHGALTDTATLARWQTLQATLDSAIVAESARWGDARYDEPITRADWHAANADVLRQMPGNGEKLLELTRAVGDYPLIDPPTMSPRGATFAGEQQVTLHASAGIIYYTIDGSDPRAAVTGDVAPSAQVYDATIVMTTTSTLKARLWVDGTWSALNAAHFAESSEASHVVISEIMYNPYLDEQMEFLELKNIGNTAADLSGAYFEGIDFRFDDDVTLAAGEHLVLVRDFGDFRERYAEVPIFGIYEGKLSDKGETVSLFTPKGELWLQVTYDDNYGWPLSANGAGDSLELIDPLGDVSNPHNWRASATLYGTPGTDEPGDRGLARGQ